MLFAKRVFWWAGALGVVSIALGYAGYLSGKGPTVITSNAPVMIHGFFLVAFAFQVAYLIMSTDPVRYRPLMLAAMLEKFPYFAANVVLFMQGNVEPVLFASGIMDGIFGLFFVAAYIATREATHGKAG